MPTAPLYRRGDSVYLKGSAEIGKLEAYRVNSIKQMQDGRWVYRIDIGKKPPDGPMIGDKYDSRICEGSLYYTEGELVTVCEALDIIVLRFSRNITRLEQAIASKCAESDAPEVFEDEPRWAIGDTVYFDASARIGFLHSDIITAIHEVGIQPGSHRTRYCYQVRNVPNKQLYFREDELITYCEAAEKALPALQRDLAAAEAKRTQLCTAGI